MNFMKTLLAKLLGITTNILEFMLPLMRAMLATGLAALLPLALEIVRSLDRKDMSNSQKFKTAVSALRAEAIAQGINAGTNLIENAVNIAVAKLREGAK
jgi:hypothetical protein